MEENPYQAPATPADLPSPPWDWRAAVKAVAIGAIVCVAAVPAIFLALVIGIALFTPPEVLRSGRAGPVENRRFEQRFVGPVRLGDLPSGRHKPYPSVGIRGESMRRLPDAFAASKPNEKRPWRAKATRGVRSLDTY
jgi:hypothetical protein